MEPVERQHQTMLRRALVIANGSPTRAAELLGLSRATIYRWMKRYEMEALASELRIVHAK